MQTLHLENIKCGACANFIETKLSRDFNLEKVTVDYVAGTVSFSDSEDLDMEALIKALARMGYPHIGEGSTLQKAKSYVSCMIGRIN